MFSQNGQLRGALVRLAEEIVRGGTNGPEANERFKSMIGELSNLEESLEALPLSDTYVFVYATNMLKLIESGDFCSITETRSEENILSLTDTPSQKSRTFGRVMAAALNQLLSREKLRYIEKSLVDLIAICLKVLLEDNNNEGYLQNVLSTFLPGYRLDNRLLTSTCDLIVTPIEPRRDFQLSNLQGYCLAVRVMVSMFEYVTVQGGSKSYYEYRKCIYVFRNSYLPYFLQFGVEHLKMFLPLASAQLRLVIGYTFQLLESVFMYPFTLSLHEFENDEDTGENITGVTAGDIYLPNFFRHVVCDETLLGGIMRYWHILVSGSNSFEEARIELHSILRVLGRSTCSSQYTFKGDDERLFARNFAQNMIDDIMSSFRFYDSYYLHAILDILQKHLTMHDSILIEIKRNILFKVTSFLKLVVRNSNITPFDGKRNPLTRAFEIVASVSDYAKDKLTQEEFSAFKEECQGMLELAFQRITGPQTDIIMQKYGQNQPGEIENFSDLYEGLLPIFEAGLDRNLALFQQLNIGLLGAGAKIMWLHLCAQLLPKTQANPRQTAIILKYYELANKGDSLAALRYIRTLAEQVLSECSEGVSATVLWRNISDLSQVPFQNFMMNVINTCIANFSNPCGEVVDYSLQFFRSIYSLLRKHDTKAFQTYYTVVRQLLPAIQTTIFVSPQHFPKRRTFFNVISLIWVNGESVEYLYQIHRLISSGLTAGTPAVFCQYLHDITGIIEPVDRYESFEVIVDLAIADLKSLFIQHFKDEQSINLYLSDPFFSKIFCRLVLALITDVNRKLYFETHTDIPLRIHQLLFPLVTQLATANRDREVSPQLPLILERMVPLHPLAPLASFRDVVGSLRPLEGFDRLVRAYFQHIQRVQDIGWLYDLIEQNIEFMMMWWEEAIFRDMHPNVNLRTIAEARIWTSIRQKENLAKLIFEIGYYDGTYWNVADFRSERDFITYFNNLYP